MMRITTSLSITPLNAALFVIFCLFLHIFAKVRFRSRDMRLFSCLFLPIFCLFLPIFVYFCLFLLIVAYVGLGAVPLQG
jgi:hypothetical protein